VGWNEKEKKERRFEASRRGKKPIQSWKWAGWEIEQNEPLKNPA